MLTTNKSMQFIYLPNELLISIFEFLSNCDLIHAVGLVDKQWRTCMMTKKTWKERKIACDSLAITNLKFINKCGITRFSVHSGEQLDMIVPTLYSTVTKLKLGWDTDEAYDTTLLESITEFPSIVSLGFSFYYSFEFTRLMKRWIPLMPNLTSLSCSCPWNEQWREIIFNCKNLKKIFIPLITETGTIELFKQLPLLENVSLTFKTSSSIWKHILEMDNVCNRLNKLCLSNHDSSSRARYEISAPTLCHMSNLTDLTIFGELVNQSDLLYSASLSLFTDTYN
jgi:hypothetical protein